MGPRLGAEESAVKIVIAEDGKDQARILIAVLKRSGYEIVWFENGYEAYEALQTGDLPDLLITDVMMPGMSGFELLTRLKTDGRMPPSIVLTSKQREEDVLRGLELGILDYVTKPFSPTVVSAKVKTLSRGKPDEHAALVDHFRVDFSASSSEALATALTEHSRLYFGFSSQQAQSYRGRIWSIGTGYKFLSGMTLDARYDNLQRTYSGGTAVEDAAASVSSTQTLNRGFYIEERFAFSATGAIYAQSSAAVTPHLAVGSHDFGLGFKYDEFRLSKAGTLAPSYIYFVDEIYAAGITAYVVRTDVTSTAGQLFLSAKLADMHALRLSLAGGRTVEDAGVTADFQAATLSYFLDFARRWSIGLSGTAYESDLRREKSLNFSLGYK